MVKWGTGDSEDQHLLLTEPLAQANTPKAQAIAFFLHGQAACASDRQPRGLARAPWRVWLRLASFFSPRPHFTQPLWSF